VEDAVVNKAACLLQGNADNPLIIKENLQTF